MKEILYRGVLQFRIPKGWVEEYETNGGAVFYEDIVDSPTLRLNILTFEAPRDVKAEAGSEVLRPVAEKYGVSVCTNRSGNAFITYDEAVQENGEELNITYWRVANIVEPRHVRIAVFSLTMLSAQQSDPMIQSEKNVISDEIGDCKFIPQLGLETPS